MPEPVARRFATYDESCAQAIEMKEEQMYRNRSIAVACSVFTLILVLGTPGGMHGQDQSDAKMGPMDPYLMDRNEEIAEARTAAPADVSRDATILVLGRNGYETAVKGTNGFVCLVERGWTGPLGGITFSPRIHSPNCLNPQAARFVLPIDFKRTELALAGQSKEQIIEWTKAAYAKGELPSFEPGAMGGDASFVAPYVAV
jgi:hypothetical protein